MKLTIIKTHKGVQWLDDQSGNLKGAGFINKDNGKVALIRCPKCNKENYAMNVMSGHCTWCPFDANEGNENE